MAVYYTQILNPESKKIITGAFSLAGQPLKDNRTILLELKNAISKLPSDQKIFSLHSSGHLFYFKITNKITISSIVDKRTGDKTITKYFDQVEKEFMGKYKDFNTPHYEFDDTLKNLTDSFNKDYKVFQSVEELESTHNALVENLDTLIHRGENLKNLQGLAEKVNFETREMSKKVNQMKKNVMMEQYKIYMVVILSLLLLIFLYFRWG